MGSSRNPNSSPLSFAWSYNGRNFEVTGKPSRFLFYVGLDGSERTWIDFRERLVNTFKKHFEAKESVIMVRVKGNTYIVDFRRMFVFWKDIRCVRSIAWVDEAGTRFDPFRTFYCECWHNDKALDNFTSYGRADAVQVLLKIPDPYYYLPLFPTFEVAKAA
ncbi:hypothetical protein KSP39_PZI020285 [Platanthera zijinensis]|uniref:RCD1 WWE domain-containing protein n=1 Tax=Platanthera zijinensis TaxID=2320716 RepID=A0AAP0AZZ3_9ASPA